jgi:hypothetical protein
MSKARVWMRASFWMRMCVKQRKAKAARFKQRKAKAARIKQRKAEAQAQAQAQAQACQVGSFSDCRCCSRYQLKILNLFPVKIDPDLVKAARIEQQASLERESAGV